MLAAAAVLRPIAEMEAANESSNRDLIPWPTPSSFASGGIRLIKLKMPAMQRIIRAHFYGFLGWLATFFGVAEGSSCWRKIC